ncbi:MAG: class I SAM-dependent methyltransferase [Candidatus Krumholzibacteria bacterium]|nr:class I SAM-dependent methyltransferase [Candidatus Krumholzibacteria bacterium]
MSRHVAEAFERGFLARSLEKQVAECDRYELAPLFLELFRDRQPVLEAGCGSGQWCAWFHQHGIRSDGIDWSGELCARAASAIPGPSFVSCDMAATPFPDGSYGGIVALGSVEHCEVGPARALAEFRRLLRPGGIALVTVPYGGALRRVMRAVRSPAERAKSWRWVRLAFGKPVGGGTLRSARTAANRAWHPRFTCDREGWSFYEYEFDKAQMRAFIARAGLEVRDEFVAFHDQGITRSFGVAAGRWNSERCDVDFTPMGRILRTLLPPASAGHMLCYVLRKES